MQKTATPILKSLKNVKRCLVLSLVLLFIMTAVLCIDRLYTGKTKNGTKSSLKDTTEDNQIFSVYSKPGFNQNDSGLLKYLRDYHLWHALPLPYNLSKPLEDPTRREGQNKVILRLLKNKKNGIFIEAGANDGEFLSNTLALERDFGWTGILVEPDKKAFKVLQSKNRKAWLSNVCLSVSPRLEKVKFLQYRRTSTWSKIANVSDNHKEWDPSLIDEVDAECVPFYSLVLALNMTKIDYFSLDIEGAELDVLKTIPFELVLIRTLSIEFSPKRKNSKADKELQLLMKSNGFTLVKEIRQGFAEDYIYAHHTVLGK